ncbi:hypothetical protein [Methanocaldococcus fervens]|uniref:Uncharacterized protein n=1 Tax=Methanocaldococcus fervens (strain DSM 4213 / JCM 15782 / AG86) TaxID=573064 RepID=C7P8H6_METFA|nr:hypothetical protein [Methanocaldococcus fervens]ACV24858.1 hypothetical protein Mefer_1041 [Methanocaldococcus fervens AG86]
MSINELMEKIISNKIKLSLLCKFKSIEQYKNELYEDIAVSQMKDVEALYEKYIMYVGENLNISVELSGDIKEILKETIELEKKLIKECGMTFGIRQTTIHCLTNDERFYFYLNNENKK